MIPGSGSLDQTETAFPNCQQERKKVLRVMLSNVAVKNLVMNDDITGCTSPW